MQQKTLQQPRQCLYSSWIPFQQERPLLYVAAVIMTGGKLLVKEDQGEWGLPMTLHSGTVPGVGSAVCRIAEECGIERNTSMALKQVGDFDMATGQPSTEDPYVTVVKVSFSGRLDQRRGYTLVGSLEEFERLHGAANPLLKAAMTTLFPNSAVWSAAARDGVH